jgi:hypothetical protein
MTKDGGRAHSDRRRMLPARRPGPPRVVVEVIQSRDTLYKVPLTRVPSRE